MAFFLCKLLPPRSTFVTGFAEGEAVSITDASPVIRAGHGRRTEIFVMPQAMARGTHSVSS